MAALLFGAPDDVQNDISKIWILIVAVPAPATGLQIYFYIAGARCVGSKLENRATKIRAGLSVPEARMKNPKTLAV
jgi:hypothetical protein